MRGEMRSNGNGIYRNLVVLFKDKVDITSRGMDDVRFRVM
jgi:hypothetical protein